MTTDPDSIEAIHLLMKDALQRIAALKEADAFKAQQIADEALHIAEEIDLDMLDDYASYKLRSPRPMPVFATGLEGAFQRDKPIGKASSRWEALRLIREYLAEHPWSEAEIENRFPDPKVLQPKRMKTIFTPSAYYLDDGFHG